MNLAIVAEEYLNDADEGRFFEVCGAVREIYPRAVWFTVGSVREPRAFWKAWRMAVEAENIDLRGFDAVVSLGSGFAHGAITQLKTRHMSYLLSPPSLWSDPGRAGHWYRIWSLARSAQVEHWIAGSEAAADHLTKAWRVKEVSQAYSTPDFKKYIEEIIINDEITNHKSAHPTVPVGFARQSFGLSENNKQIPMTEIPNSKLFPGHAYLFEGSLADWQERLALFRDAFAPEDQTVFAPERESGWGIRDVRSLIGWAALKPYHGSRKLAILESVERLTREAADAFLKTLEEPPPSTVFFLFSRFPGAVPKTIRSRLIFASGAASAPSPSLEEIRRLKELVAMPVASRLKESARYAEAPDAIASTLEAWLRVLRASLIGEQRFEALDLARTALLMRRMLKASRLLRETNAQPRLVLDALFTSW